MVGSGSRPAGADYIPVGQSGRWNRAPVPITGKSEDGRVGGGVSLTAVSNPYDDRDPPAKNVGDNDKKDEKTVISSQPLGSDKGKKKLACELKSNAKPWVASDKLATPSESTSAETTAASTEDGATGKHETNIAKQQDDADGKTDMQKAFSILMGKYVDIEHALSEEEQRIVRNAHGSYMPPVAVGGSGKTTTALADTAQRSVDHVQTTSNSMQRNQPVSSKAHPEAERASKANADGKAADKQMNQAANKYHQKKGKGKSHGKPTPAYGPRLGAPPQLAPGMSSHVPNFGSNTYPPIIDHEETRRRAQERMKSIYTPTPMSREERRVRGENMQLTSSQYHNNGLMNSTVGMPPHQQFPSPMMDFAPQYSQGQQPFNGMGNPPFNGPPRVYHPNQQFPPPGNGTGAQYPQGKQLLSGTGNPSVSAYAGAGAYIQQPNTSYGPNYQHFPPPFTGYPPPQYQGAGIRGHVQDPGPFQAPRPQYGSSGAMDGYNYGLVSNFANDNMPLHHSNPPQNAPVATIPSTPAKTLPIVEPLDFAIPTDQVMNKRSQELNVLAGNGKPTVQNLLDPKYIPFIECTKHSFPSEESGVVIIKNIPYETTRSEILALLGRSSRVLADTHEPIHITVDLVTCKTKHAFCELTNLHAAIELVERFKKSATNSRNGRLGSRVVDVELSSQTNLMLALFPSSRHGVVWMGAKPRIVQETKWDCDGFKSFLTEEEISMLAKHTESPQRSLYARLCPERPYECMISILRKVPWHMTEYIKIKERHAVYEACRTMVQTLAGKFRRVGGLVENEEWRLTPQLLDRLLISAMVCPGFSVIQKYNIGKTGGMSEARMQEFNQPRNAEMWRHLWTLVPKADMPVDVLEWYISVIRAETTRVVQSLHIFQRMELEAKMKGLEGKMKGLEEYWGYFWTEVDYPVGAEWDNMSLADCSQLEWRAIERILTRAVEGGYIPISYYRRS